MPLRQLISWVTFMTVSVTCAQQNCDLSLSGRVVCTRLNEELGFASIYSPELKRNITVNEKSHFYIGKLCPGTYHFRVAFVGHKTLDTSINLQRNTELLFNLLPESGLEEVEIEGHQLKKQEMQTLQQSALSGGQLDRTRGTALASALQEIPGVTVLQSGPTVSKPMINGLTGSRVLILNNGVRLESQSWGADHAPEIDPYSAGKLTVIKGPAAIRYGMEALGGVILAEPADMPHHRSLAGEINAAGISNGRAGALSASLEGGFGGKLSGLAWRVQRSVREGGNVRTPAYFIGNTGFSERNFSGALAFNRKSYGVEMYYSSFTSTIGIPEAGEVETIAGLREIYARGGPESPGAFSYDLDGEKQDIAHEMLKARAFYNFRKAGKFDLIIAKQQNRRAEFGEPDSAFPGMPEARFRLDTWLAELVWEQPVRKRINGSAGITFMTHANVFDGLEERALVPTYNDRNAGLFFLEKLNIRKWTFEAGIRYDVRSMRAFPADTAGILVMKDRIWQNLSGSLGALYRISRKTVLSTAFTSGWRPPSSIELFSDGIHQGALSFESGNADLHAERSYQLQGGITHRSPRLRAEISFHGSNIRNYIYLKPEVEGGATDHPDYLHFSYAQGDALIAGGDLASEFKMSKHWSVTSRASWVYGYNLSSADHLPMMPPARFTNGFMYRADSVGRFLTVFAGATFHYVMRQQQLPAAGDFVTSPGDYGLLNAEIGGTIKAGRSRVIISFAATNLLNKRYRDYLDRARYFIDQAGTAYMLRIRIPFIFFGEDSSEH